MKTTFAALFSLLSIAGTAMAENLWVTIDHTRLYTSDTAIGTLVVGNPAIADINVKSNRELIIFGRAPGTTSITLYTPTGEELDTLYIAVRNPSGNRVTLQEGSFRYSFACTDVCEQVPTIGDGSKETLTNYATLIEQIAAGLSMTTQASETQTGGVPVSASAPLAIQSAETQGKPSL